MTVSLLKYRENAMDRRKHEWVVEENTAQSHEEAKVR